MKDGVVDDIHDGKGLPGKSGAGAYRGWARIRDCHDRQWDGWNRGRADYATLSRQVGECGRRLEPGDVGPLANGEQRRRQQHRGSNDRAKKRCHGTWGASFPEAGFRPSFSIARAACGSARMAGWLACARQARQAAGHRSAGHRFGPCADGRPRRKSVGGHRDRRPAHPARPAIPQHRHA